MLLYGHIYSVMLSDPDSLIYVSLLCVCLSVQL